MLLHKACKSLPCYINYSIILLMNNIHYKQYNQCIEKIVTPIAYCVHYTSQQYQVLRIIY